MIFFKKMFINNSTKKWIILGVGFFMVFGLLTFSLIGITSSINEPVLYSLVGGFVGLFFFSFLFLLDKQINRVISRVRDAELELQAAVGINKLTKQPLNLGGWAITAHFLNRLVSEIYYHKPDLIVECGSGTSTLVISSCLKDIGRGKVISLDHLKEYANHTRGLLEREKTDQFAQVVTAPLSEYELDERTFKWYGKEFQEHIDGKINMLIVDGPPAPLQHLSRYPAVPLLKEFLADECLIMMDDANREDEKEIVQKWGQMLGTDIEINQNCRGYAIIKNEKGQH